MPSFYQEPSHGFGLFQTPEVPGWRPPQRGALGALLGYWAVHRVKPALIAVPTGSGKTAIALATPYLVKSSRTLVVVPSTQLRSQTVSAFQKQEVLRQMGALAGTANPKVLEVKGRLTSWHDCEDADVVVALPQSISPEHYSEGSKAPVDLFDLVIVDEAHHAPAPTWRAILDHFDGARKVLLTATPRRRDGKRVPGEMIFHYPLRAAMSDGYYKRVQARLLSVSASAQRRECDELIRDAIVNEFNRPEHASSTLLVRAGTRSRVASFRGTESRTSSRSRRTVASYNRGSPNGPTLSEVPPRSRLGRRRSTRIMWSRMSCTPSMTASSVTASSWIMTIIHQLRRRKRSRTA